MKPIKFPGSNIVIAENQPEYLPLPALLLPGRQTPIITCWQFTDEEIERIVKNRKMYIKQLTFAQPVQPILPLVELSDDITLM